MIGEEETLTPAEVARLFRVDPKTVTRWASSGKLRSFKTPGGHRRFLEREVRDLLDRCGRDAADPVVERPQPDTASAMADVRAVLGDPR